MATKIKKILPDIEFLSLLKRSERESYLKKAKMVHIKLYKTFIANIYFRNVPISSEAVKKLKCYRSKLAQICAKTSSVKNVRNLLIDKDFFAKFLKIVLIDIQPLVYKKEKEEKEEKKEKKKDKKPTEVSKKRGKEEKKESLHEYNPLEIGEEEPEEEEEKEEEEEPEEEEEEEEEEGSEEEESSGEE